MNRLAGGPGAPWSIVVPVVLWRTVGNGVPVDRVSVDRNGTKNRFANGYGTDDVTIRIIMGLFGIIWESVFMGIICKS